MSIDEQAEKISLRMYKNRLSNRMEPLKDWHMIKRFGSNKRRQVDEIKGLLASGKKVTAGYFCTSVRGYHDYAIFWKEK